LDAERCSGDSRHLTYCASCPARPVLSRSMSPHSPHLPADRWVTQLPIVFVASVQAVKKLDAHSDWLLAWYEKRLVWHPMEALQRTLRREFGSAARWVKASVHHIRHRRTRS
jgi:hypothetical protein